MFPYSKISKFLSENKNKDHLYATDQEEPDVSTLDYFKFSLSSNERTSKCTLFFSHRRRRRRFTLCTTIYVRPHRRRSLAIDLECRSRAGHCKTVPGDPAREAEIERDRREREREREEQRKCVYNEEKQRSVVSLVKIESRDVVTTMRIRINYRSDGRRHDGQDRHTHKWFFAFRVGCRGLASAPLTW